MSSKALSRLLGPPVRRGLRSHLRRDLIPAIDSLPGHLAVLFDRCAINCVVDVGANVGGFGRLLRQQGYRGKLVSFEPSREVFRVLEREALRDGRWSVYNCALGESTGKRLMNISLDSSLSSLLPPNEFGRASFNELAAKQQEEPIVERRLDDIYREFTKEADRVYLKIDTQGWDLHVLRGGTTFLNRVQALQFEMAFVPIYEGAPSYNEALDYLIDSGFNLTGLFPVARDENSLRLVEMDCVMTR